MNPGGCCIQKRTQFPQCYSIVYKICQLHTGVAVGPEFCGPESPAIRDPNLWVVTIGKCCIRIILVTVLSISFTATLFTLLCS